MRNCTFKKDSNPLSLLLASKTRIAPVFDLPMPGFSCRIFSDMDQVAPLWRLLQPADNIFLTESYLLALERALPENITPFYIVISKNGAPAGLAYLQLIDFRADESIQSPEPQGVAPRLIHCLRKKIESLFRFNMLVLGNVLLTGPRGYAFLPHITNEAEYSALLAAAMPIARQYLERSEGRPIRAFVVKDLPDGASQTETWTGKRFREFRFLPNMVMALRPEWRTFDDYLDSLLSKYRVRTRRAIKMLGNLEVRTLSPRDIADLDLRIRQLYRQVAESVDFNLAFLHPRYFSSLQSDLGANFQMTGYFLDGQLVGFYTIIINGEELDAHYMGFDQALNRERQLYFNMLLDMIRKGLSLGLTRISFARTAMEIKSSVGAEEEQLKSFFRHESPLVNFLLKPIVHFLEPRQTWVLRHPFKGD